MAEKRTCDCCGLPIAEYDAGAMPVMVRTETGILLQVTVLPTADGSRPMVRAGCVKDLVHKGELVFPRLPVVDGKAVLPMRKEATP